MIYVGTPYTLYEGGHELAHIHAASATAMAVRRGLCVYSPITHGHPLSVHGGLPLDNHEFWDKINRPFMDLCSGLLVIKMPGWQYSKGLGHEIDVFHDAGKPIGYMAWPDDSISGLKALREAERAQA